MVSISTIFAIIFAVNRVTLASPNSRYIGARHNEVPLQSNLYYFRLFGSWSLGLTERGPNQLSTPILPTHSSHLCCH